MKNQPMNKLFSFLAGIALAANVASPSVSFAEDDMMGSMPSNQQNSMQSDPADTGDSTDMDHDHDQMKKDHAQMKKDHKMMKHGQMMKKHNMDKDKGSQNKSKSKNNKKSSDPGMMDDDQMGPGGMDHM